MLKEIKQQGIIGQQYNDHTKYINHSSIIIGYIDDNNLVSTHKNKSNLDMYENIHKSITVGRAY